MVFAKSLDTAVTSNEQHFVQRMILDQIGTGN